MRPLFPESWRNETQIVSMVLSADSANDPDVIAVTSASAAAYCSDLPFETPIAAVRVGLLNGQLVVNPTVSEQKTSLLNIVIAGSEEGIVMVESGALEVSEEAVVDALEFGHTEIKKIVAAIRELHAQLKPKKVVVAPLPFDQALYNEIEKKHGAKLKDALNTEKHPKKESYHLVDELKAEIVNAIPEEDEEKRTLAKRAFEKLRENIFRDEILNARRRPDGREFDKIRKITCEVGLLPRVHGSALFTRGETQALATLTLGTKEDMQRLDLLFEQDQFKRFLLHYNFPPFSVGEVKFLRGPGRREIGHGALAERALVNLLPPETDFPVRDAARVGHSGIERILVDGNRLRRVVGTDGCWCADQVALRGYRDGTGGWGQQQILDLDGHRRGGRSLRRHGLQGGRDARGDHRAADGHQGIERHDPYDARSTRAGEKGTARNPGHDGQDAEHASRRDLDVRSAAL